MDAREVQSVIMLCHKYDIDCMVRPPTLERTQLYRYLEDGAAGIMIPFMSNADVADHVVNCTKFPPLGNRGIDGAGLDADYGVDHFLTTESTYLKDAVKETFIVGQIETLEALENLDAIASTAGIDMLFLGPADLGHRLSVADTNLTLDDAITRVAEAARRHKKSWGITAGSPADIAHYRGLGAQMIPWGGDFSLMTVLEGCSKDLDEVLGDDPPVQRA
jgi:2-keto-3-deoxy-L-rhamnonate aldolase RhmA